MKPFVSKKFINRLKKIDFRNSWDDDSVLVKPLGLKYIGRGVSCNCYGNKKIVVKIGRHNWKLNKKMKRYKHFFPQTIVINNSLCVQERCDTNRDWYDDHAEMIETIAFFFGIDDAHNENVGWKKINGEWTPIFFDMGFKMRPIGKLSRGEAKIPAWCKFGMRIK